MTQVRDVLGRARPLAVAVVFAVATLVPTLSIHFASADPLLDRSLLTTSSVTNTASTSTVPGDPGNGDNVGHTYTFTPSTTGSVVGISFEVCDTAFGYLHVAADSTDGTSDNCIETDDGAVSPGENEDVVGGFDVTAVFPNVTVAGSATGWTFAKVDASYWTLVHSSSVNFTAGTPVEIEFPASATGYFTNPTTNGTYFVHVATYSTSTVAYDTAYPATGIDEGTVTSSTATAIDINTRVQETLRFSVEGDLRNGEADNLTGEPFAGDGGFNGPRSETEVDACTPLNGLGTISMGNIADDALASNVAYDARSYFRLATNSSNGARVFYSGETLTSGSESIDAIGGTAVASTTGQEQFGLAFDNTYHTGDPLVDLASVDDLDDPLPYASDATGFAFVTATSASNVPQLLAQSDGVVGCDTGAIRYIANIAEETAAGIYSTRIVYVASPSY